MERRDGQDEQTRTAQKALLHWFTPIRDGWTVARLCRFSLLSVLTGIVFLIFVPQGVDVLLGLAAADWLAKGSFIVATALWTLSIWYFSRAILAVKYPDWPPQATDVGRRRLIDRLHKHFPRVLGVVAALSVAVALALAAAQLESGARGDLLFLAGVTVFLALVFYVFVVVRRRIFNLGEVAAEDSVPPSTRKVVVGACAAALIVGVLFAIRPANHVIAPWLGAATIVLLAAAVWVPLGSIVIHCASRYRAPALLLILVWLVACAFLNNNHDVRQLASTVPSSSTSAPQLSSRIPTQAGADKHVVLVTADGGGIRAAYWTASVLAGIQDRFPEFSSRLIVISGVSGGSVGAGVFVSLLAERRDEKAAVSCGSAPQGAAETPMVACTRRILSKDFLAPTLGTMLFPDFVQRFLPFPVPYFDRGRTLEESWERAWAGVMRNDRLAARFDELWSAANRGGAHVPSLILNATDVRTGKRMFTSDFAFDALDALNLREHAPHMRMSTAMHNSARFTYVSPAGRLPNGEQVVDGGYFENTGATALLDVLRVLDSYPENERVVPIVIRIKNAPEGEGETPRALRLSSQVWAPVQTLAATREARGTYAVRALESTVLGMKGRYVEVRLRQSSVALPLGWALSEPARREMDRQLDERLCSGSPLSTALEPALGRTRAPSCTAP